MFFFRNNKNKNNPQPKADNDNAGPKDAPKQDKNNKPERPKKSLRQNFDDAVRGMRGITLRDLGGTAAHTVRDLRKPKEIGILVVAMIVPGGMFGWSAYRLKQFKDKTSANQNLLPPPDNKPALPPPADTPPLTDTPTSGAAADKNPPQKPGRKNSGPGGPR